MHKLIKKIMNKLLIYKLILIINLCILLVYIYNNKNARWAKTKDLYTYLLFRGKSGHMSFGRMSSRRTVKDLEGNSQVLI
jgi:hypothetical protein